MHAEGSSWLTVPVVIIQLFDINRKVPNQSLNKVLRIRLLVYTVKQQKIFQ